MREYTRGDILSFKRACRAVKAQGHLNEWNGLCGAIKEQGCLASYGIMQHFLTSAEYSVYYGLLGRAGEFSQARQDFLDLLIVMPVADMLELANAPVLLW